MKPKTRTNLLICFILCVVTVFGQTQRSTSQKNNVASSGKTLSVKDKKESPYTAPLFNGVTVGVDLFDPIANLFGQKYGGYEANVEVNLYNRFMPIWEIGIGRANDTPDDQNYTYVGKPALYNRIGLNYNFKYKNTSPNFFYIGLRYGLTSFDYNIKDIHINSPYWNENYTVDIPDQHSFAHWIEGVLGIRVNIYKGVMMGWNIRYKWILNEKKNFNSESWYIPGYGVRGTPISFSYCIYYKLPLGKKSKVPTPAIGEQKK